jgi:hypothetical protein
VRGFAAEIDGRLVGYAGVMYDKPLQAFSSITDDEFRKHPRVIMHMGRKMAELMTTINAPIYALVSETEKNSRRFLEAVGFEHFQDSDRGTLYKWPIRYQQPY